MKVLSIRPPWSDLIAMEIKKAEFRSWTAKYRGPVVIHASKRVDKAARDRFLRVLDKPWELFIPEDKREKLRGYLTYPRCGVALAIANLASIERSEYHYKELGFTEESFAWIFDDVKLLKTEVPLRGRLGLWTVKDEEEKRVQLAMFRDAPKIQLDTQASDTGEEEYIMQGGKRYVKKGLFKVPVED